MDGARPHDVLWSFKHSQRNWSVGQILDICDLAESTDDFHAVFFSDHLRSNTPDGWTMMSFAFARTKRIRSGPWVTSNEFRHPAATMKLAASMDVLSSGRFILGLGASHEVDEFAMYGLAFPSPGERVGRLAETCEIANLAFTGEPVNFHGKYYNLTDALILPVPIQRPRPYLALGCKGDRAMRVAARYADEWSLSQINTESAGFIDRSNYLDRVCQEIGRDPKSIRRAASFRYIYEGLTSGRLSRVEVVDAARRIIRAGCGHFILMLGEGKDGVTEVEFLRDEFIPEVMSGLP